MESALPSTQTRTLEANSGRRDTLTIIDNRTGRSYEIPITNDTIHATELRKIKVDEGDFGMMSYDPSFGNTASCISRITYIDGDKGILRYRGYPIEELAEKSTYLETAYLLLKGELPNGAQLKEWQYNITHHTYIHESIKKFLDGFHYDAHPMGMLISTIAGLSTFYPDSKHIFDAESRKKQTYRLIGKMPTLAAFSYRHTLGMPYVYPDNDLSYTGNFLNMLFRTSETRYRPNPTLERALDVLFILHADHEQNCSANTIRSVGSSHADPFCASAAATAALYGPLHGGANEEALRMLMEIGSVQKVPEFIKRVKAGETRLMGFGHRIYKNYDPRARIIKKIAYEVFDLMGKNPLLEIALECERIALEDEYFIKRKLYPNVDFYTGLIYQSMGFPMTMFPVLFAIPRMSGWVAQWEEMLLDPEQKIARPRQVYLGYNTRPYVPLDQRG
ncbi:MAG: citrate synthase [Candidatus Acidiferrum sp.]